MRVYLSENAFLDLVLSSVEVYKKECFGFLLGYKLADRFIIEHAFTVQIAERGLKSVEYKDKHFKRIAPILNRLKKLEKIGDFHSHTQFGLTKGLSVPSREDIKEMVPHNIYLIVAINNKEKKMDWGENRDGTISGSVGKFFFKISGHFVNGKTSLRRARIHCPFPPGF
jgi:proteasome lid subunit RPN8/RPN11